MTPVKFILYKEGFMTPVKFILYKEGFTYRVDALGTGSPMSVSGRWGGSSAGSENRTWSRRVAVFWLIKPWTDGIKKTNQMRNTAQHKIQRYSDWKDSQLESHLQPQYLSQLTWRSIHKLSR